MRTSLNEIEQIENYLFHQLSAEEELTFRQQLSIDPVLRSNVYAQQKVYSLIRVYHRKKLKEEVEKIHTRLFTDPVKRSFRQMILQIFNS